jgi:hypothetical protein
LRGLQPFKDTGFHQSEQPAMPGLRRFICSFGDHSKYLRHRL